MQPQLDCGNWIRKKNLVILGLVVLGVGILALLPLDVPFRIAAAILFLLVLITFLLPLYAYIMFSQRGGRLQEKVYDLILQSLGTTVTGTILDIGSGNGVLAVKLAMQQPGVEVEGTDYWGDDWEYSKSVCEQNARTAQVGGRVHFEKGDAAALRFADQTFDGAISNLTFHEVKSVADKRLVLAEALRVVKAEGHFAFVDYFYDAKYYGDAATFRDYLNRLNLSEFEYKPLGDMLAIPTLLRHPKILGKVGVIYGRK